MLNCCSDWLAHRAVAHSCPERDLGRESTRLSEEDAVIAAVAAYDCKLWLRMSRWAKVNEILEPRERSLAYSVEQ